MFAEPLQQVDRTFVRYRGRKLIYFGGCDYLRLSSHPRVIRAVERTIRRFGLNVAASRRTTGNHELYGELEEECARFFGAERAVLASNGYLTNLIAAQGLAGTITHALIDERAHQSLKDAAVLLGARTRTFRHRDPGSLAKLAARIVHPAKAAILTDGMFAHDGSIAPLNEYRKELPLSLLWVDDSHAAGVLGLKGRGTIELLGLPRRGILQTVTFSKAFGVYGGAVLAGKKVCAEILGRSGIAVGNTPLPLPLAGGVLESLRIARNRELRERLRRNIELFHRTLGEPVLPSPIIGRVPESDDAAEMLRERLLKAKIFPPFVRYPGGPEKGYFRFALSCEHSPEQVLRLADCLRK